MRTVRTPVTPTVSVSIFGHQQTYEMGKVNDLGFVLKHLSLRGIGFYFLMVKNYGAS